MFPRTQEKAVDGQRVDASRHGLTLTGPISAPVPRPRLQLAFMQPE